MKRTFARSSTIAAAICIHCFASSAARADDIVVPSSSSQPVAESESAGLSHDLLRSGLFTLGASYVPALVVAIESDVDADQHLYVPIMGPWLDLSSRESCEAECSAETVNEALLAADGVFQGLGALQILGSFIQPETRALTVSEADGSVAISFRVQPTHIRRGSGLIAIGNF
jgi:hypothetical protein